jgi:hypothetical protein
MASKTTKTSIAANNNTVLSGIVSKGAKAVLDKRIKSISCTIITGKPRMAIITGLCWALAAIAARNVNTKLKLRLPNKVIPMKGSNFGITFPNNAEKINKLSKLINNISRELNNSFAKTKFTGLDTE